MGLRWADVDFDNGCITISRQLQKKKRPTKAEYGKGIYYFTSLKNNKSRTISPAPFIMRMLKEHRAQQRMQRMKLGTAYGNGDPINKDLVFVNDLGVHLSPNTVYKEYKRIVKSLGLENARFHDLRHTYAVTALQNGDDVKTVQETLGHHTAAFTLDTYAHVTDRMKKESAARMEAYIKTVL